MNKIKKSKIILLFLILFALEMAVLVSYPKFAKFARHSSYSISYYRYKPAKPAVSEIDTSTMPPAQAVPILMYHGVTLGRDRENTTIANFILQMEMLKRNGYQTITLEQLDNFLDGKYILPAKPIIITFDDGRKDSYYTTDDVLNKLGFSAVIFEVSGKANDNDKFYLSWSELKKMKDSGRWDIQAHGTYSHEKFVIDGKGTIGRFLSSRIYNPEKGLESVDSFNARVENDYLQNIKDLKDHLGVDTKYYAVPLNDYGEKPESNYPSGVTFNDNIITKYFRLSFIEANDAEDIAKFNIDVYNYQDSDRYKIARIEMQNMNAVVLKQVLEYNAPREPQLAHNFRNNETILSLFVYSYGNYFYNQEGFHITTAKDEDTARIIFGESRWENYAIEARIQRVDGRSAALIGHFRDTNNYVTFGMTDRTVYLREYINGKETDLAEPVLNCRDFTTGLNTYGMEFNDGRVTAKINDQVIYEGILITSPRGRIGFKVWGDTGIAESVVESLKIEPVI